MADFLETAERLRNSGKLTAPKDVDAVVRGVEELQQVFTKANLDLQNLEGIYGAVEIRHYDGKVIFLNPAVRIRPTGGQT